MSEPNTPQPGEEDKVPAPVEDERPVGIFTNRELPTKTRKMLWAIGIALGVGYILYGLWGMFTGS